jgi:hypothetical protein
MNLLLSDSDNRKKSCTILLDVAFSKVYISLLKHQETEYQNLYSDVAEENVKFSWVYLELFLTIKTAQAVFFLVYVMM